jgi:hypothetical protein
MRQVWRADPSRAAKCKAPRAENQHHALADQGVVFFIQLSFPVDQALVSAATGLSGFTPGLASRCHLRLPVLPLLHYLTKPDRSFPTKNPSPGPGEGKDRLLTT